MYPQKKRKRSISLNHFIQKMALGRSKRANSCENNSISASVSKLKNGLSSKKGGSMSTCPSTTAVGSFCSIMAPSMTLGLAYQGAMIPEKSSPDEQQKTAVYRSNICKYFNRPLIDLFIIKRGQHEVPNWIDWIFREIYIKGPFTQGIFRKNGSSKVLKDLIKSIQQSYDDKLLNDLNTTFSD